MSEKLDVIELKKEYVDGNVCIIKYACPTHTKDTVKINGGDDWLIIEFAETEFMGFRRFNYETQAPVKAINCKFVNGILECKIQFEVPKARKLNVVFD